MSLHKSFLKAISVFTATALVLFTTSCNIFNNKEDTNSFSSTNVGMGTYIKQTVYGDNANECVVSAMQEINALEQEISWRIDTSVISKINNEGYNSPISVSERLYSILLLSNEVSQKSNGAYDCTILPVSSLWNLDKEPPVIPSEDDIEKNVKLVNYNNLILSDNKCSLLLEGMGIDLGGCGKGAACDAAIEVYKKMGAEGGFVAVGGSIGVFGKKKDSSIWSIGIRDPTKSSSDVMGVLYVENICISTSGDYEKYAYADNIYYHHILNPQTGYPCEKTLSSVTVLHSSGALTDMLSTACFVLGYEKGTELLKQFDAYGVFITQDGKVYASKELQNSFEVTSNEYEISEWF